MNEKRITYRTSPTVYTYIKTKATVYDVAINDLLNHIITEWVRAERVKDGTATTRQTITIDEANADRAMRKAMKLADKLKDL